MENTISYHRVNSFVDVYIYIYIYVIATWSRAYLMSLTPRPFIARLTASYAYSLVRSSRLYRLPSLTTMIDDHRLYLDKGLASSFYFFFFFFLTPRIRGLGVKMWSVRAACIRACPTRNATIPFVGGLLTFPWRVGQYTVELRKEHWKLALNRLNDRPSNPRERERERSSTDG